ncbi:dienelactone hydrolase family protein [Reyranella soli]|uniref:dienelactone hydrolase family protein n=1 Tax=Reyranella soli TaxID=1230389 RepID=UPI0014783845|nr:dienelactone hydrolase family protein [Reyranella soli]
MAKAALALVLPFILAHCASLLSDRLPLKYDAQSVGGPNSGAPLQLYLPPGDGPFPAVVVMHSCSGITDNTRTWATRLVNWGYAALIVDSFGPRNSRSVCENVDSIPTRVRAQDAHNAATYLRTLPNIQAERIGIIGFSHGGSSTLWAAIGVEIPVDRGGHPFQAGVAYYPGCSGRAIVGPYVTDVLILTGKNDTWTPADLASRRLRREPTTPVRPPSRSIPVRCTASTSAPCPHSPVPAT